MRRDRQAIDDQEAMLRNARQAELNRERLNSREALDGLVNRRRAKLRNEQARDQDEANRQQQATSIYLRSEADRLRLEERRYRPAGAGVIDDRPFPITGP